MTEGINGMCGVGAYNRQFTKVSPKVSHTSLSTHMNLIEPVQSACLPYFSTCSISMSFFKNASVRVLMDSLLSCKESAIYF